MRNGLDQSLSHQQVRRLSRMTYDRLRSVVEFLPCELESCQSLSDSFSPDRGRFSWEHLPVTHNWKNPLFVYATLLRDLSKFVSGGDAHLVAVHLRPDVQRTPEHPRKSEGVIDLVRKVLRACCTYPCCSL